MLGPGVPGPNTIRTPGRKDQTPCGFSVQVVGPSMAGPYLRVRLVNQK